MTERPDRPRGDVAALRILHVEDDGIMAALVREMLADQVLIAVDEVVHVETSNAAAAALTDDGPWHAVLVDLSLPDAEGMALLDTVAVHAPDSALVVLTGKSDPEVGVEALRRGAVDFLVKGELSGTALARCLQFAVERQNFLKQLRSLADTDELTHLYNRRALTGYYDHMLAGAQRSGHRIAVAMMDINGFKELNDTYGHGFGDRVLVGIADGLRKTVRAQDMVARIGGDEFVVCATVTSAADSERLKQRLAKFASSVVPTLKVRVELAVGLAETEGGESLDSLLARADSAMYRHKRGDSADIPTNGHFANGYPSGDPGGAVPAPFEAPLVLVIAADPFDSALICDAVTAYHGYTVVRAASIPEAIDAFSDDVACVILDPTVPDGRTDDRLAEVGRFDRPVVVVSGADDTVGPAMIRAGAQDFIRRSDIRSETIVRAVDYAIARHDHLRSSADSSGRPPQIEQDAAEQRRTQAGLDDDYVLDAGELLSVFCHDLSSTAWAVEGFTSRLPDDLPITRTLKEVAGHFSDQMKAIRMLRALYEDKTAVTEVNVRAVVRELVNNRRAAHPGEVTLTVRGDEGTLRTNATLLTNALEAVLDNACTYSATDGGAVDVTWTLNSEGLRISIKDNGIGMSDFIQEHATRMFYRGVKKSDFEGTGVGLTFTSLAVGRLGGHMELVSTEGAGTTVTLTIPQL